MMSSLRMSYKKDKWISSKAIAHHTSTAGDPDFHSSVNNVDNYLTNVLQSNPLLQAKSTPPRPGRTKENNNLGCCSQQRGPAAVFNTTRSYHHTDEEQPLLNSAPLLSNQQVPCAGPSPSPDQLTVLDWMEQAHTVL